jgi:hypothetical protein
VKRRIGSPNEAQSEQSIVCGDVVPNLLTRRVEATGIENAAPRARGPKAGVLPGTRGD